MACRTVINSLRHIKDKNPQYQYSEYEAIMPKSIPIEKSLDALSKLVKEYATTYLEEKEWKTWRDVK
jgi:two-component SAPR family response regulator